MNEARGRKGAREGRREGGREGGRGVPSVIADDVMLDEEAKSYSGRVESRQRLWGEGEGGGGGARECVEMGE